MNATLIDKEIMRLRELIRESEKKLEYLSGGELTAENYHSGNLHWELRKWTNIANQSKHVYYCSLCGERFEISKERVVHVMEDHNNEGL